MEKLPGQHINKTDGIGCRPSPVGIDQQVIIEPQNLEDRLNSANIGLELRADF